MSCTNLRTLGVIDEVSQALGKPVLSSNQALAWHMAQLNSAEYPEYLVPHHISSLVLDSGPFELGSFTCDSGMNLLRSERGRETT